MKFRSFGLKDILLDTYYILIDLVVDWNLSFV